MLQNSSNHGEGGKEQWICPSIHSPAYLIKTPPIPHSYGSYCIKNTLMYGPVPSHLKFMKQWRSWSLGRHIILEKPSWPSTERTHYRKADMKQNLNPRLYKRDRLDNQLGISIRINEKSWIKKPLPIITKEWLFDTPNDLTSFYIVFIQAIDFLL